MKEIVKIIKDEWEIAVLAGVAVILLLWGITWLDSGERVLNTPGLLIEDEAQELLTEDALEFLKGREATAVQGAKPFALPAWAHADFPKPKPKPKPAAPATKAEPVAVTAEPTPAAPEPEPVAQKNAPKPEAPVPVVAKLYFSESQEMGDGTLVALMQLTRGGFEQMITLGKGESDLGITVVNIEGKAVVVQDAKKRKLRLRTDAETKVWAILEP